MNPNKKNLSTQFNKKNTKIKDKKLDKIIWDSGFGYDLGYFIDFLEIKIINYDCKVRLVTGVAVGVVLKDFEEIEPYTKERQKAMTEKYGYNTKFSKDF